MDPDLYLRKNFRISLFGIIGFLCASWYLAVCFLLTLHRQLPRDLEAPLFSNLAQLPSWVYRHTNHPIIDIAWKYGTELPIASTPFTSAHLILIANVMLCVLFLGLSGEYSRARTAIRKYENEINKEKLREGVREKRGVVNAPTHAINEVIVNLSPHKPWHDSWWGKLLLMLVGGIALAVLSKIIGLN